ncbi:hypothetical protein JNB11_05635 [Kocuria palustris]|nr:hypothetical protein [Kocuria palustris]
MMSKFCCQPVDHGSTDCSALEDLLKCSSGIHKADAASASSKTVGTKATGKKRNRQAMALR